MNQDTRLAVNAVTQGWPITAEQLQLCVDKLHDALENTTNARDVARLTGAFARLYGQNQTERLSQKYIDAVGESVQVRPLAEEIKAMLGSLPLVPQESILNAEIITEEQSAPPLASPLSDHGAFGQGVFDSVG